MFNHLVKKPRKEEDPLEREARIQSNKISDELLHKMDEAPLHKLENLTHAKQLLSQLESPDFTFAMQFKQCAFKKGV
jgi:hypothetical protein